LAGRRIDAPDSDQPHFPATRIGDVERAIEYRLGRDGVRALVCAAANGSDLLALRIAGELGLRRRIVLPFAADIFRKMSVVDRNGYPWGELFDTTLAEVQAVGDLVVAGLDSTDPNVFEAANRSILDEALSLAAAMGDEAEALVVWDPARRTAQDFTANFADEAQKRHMPVISIGILGT
jgi:hypothetical protein